MAGNTQAAGVVGRTASAAGVAILIAVVWVLRRTWRRMLPIYWATAAWLCALAALAVDVSVPAMLACATVVALAAAGWRSRSRWVRCYRAGVAVTLGIWASVADPLESGMSIPALATATLVIGWPWWRHLRYVAEPEPVVDHTDEWVQRWRTEVIDHGVCKRTRLVRARTVRDGVVEATIQLLPGSKISEVVKTGSAVETCLRLPEGSVGWRRTGQAALLTLVIVETSHIQRPVKYRGPTYTGGRFEIITYADGTPGTWVHQLPKDGTYNGLIVGSTGSGKSRALGVICDNMLHAGVMLAIGDPQGGQCLPAWRHAAGEYHIGINATRDLIIRLHAEVMERSLRLSAEGIDAYDPNDPRVIALGIKQLAVIIDECHLVLTMSSAKEDRRIVEMMEEITSTCRKTGISVTLATQLPQMKSLGGSVRIRDATAAGNALILRITNRGSGSTILPDDFVGDPFAIPREIEIGGKKIPTAGTGYSRDGERIGMLGRVPFLDEETAASRHQRKPIEWLAEPPSQATQHADPVSARVRPSSAGASRVPPSTVASTTARLSEAFGVAPVLPAVRNSANPRHPEKARTTKDWIRARLTTSPATALGLLDRPDCPVSQPQLYAVLAELDRAGDIEQPGGRGTPWQLTS